MNTMKRNVLLLAACQAMMMTGGSLLIATSALVGYRLAPDQALATLPLALQMLAGMLASIPASLFMQRVGRRAGFVVGSSIGAAGAALAAYAIVQNRFGLFALAAALSGVFAGFGNYYRFAAADAASEEYRSRAISYVLAGGVLAALVGPNLARWTHDWLATPFAGSFVALTGIMGLSVLVQLFLRIPHTRAEAHGGGRPLTVIARQPTFVVAALSGMFGYGVMSLVMTATPLAMHAHHFAFDDTAFVIEWHVLGMFAPSFFTGQLIRRFGALQIMRLGAVLDIACVLINLSGTGQLAHYWLALTLLGVGWNFLFIGATTLLTETHRPAEKAKTQALNDFLVFSTVTLAVLSSGQLQHRFGWQAVNLGVVPLILVTLAATAWLARRRRLGTVAADQG
jgi:MFS family permease